MTGVPAAASACVLTTYTGTLLTATSTPLWAVAGNWMPVLFGASAMSTATAALSLAQHAAGEKDTLPALEKVATASAALELVATEAIEKRWKHAGVRGPIDQQPTRAAWDLGFKLLGVGLPLAIHGIAALTGRRSRRASLLASAAALTGGYVLRQMMISIGKQSAQRPGDYFRLAYQIPGEAGPSLSPHRPTAGLMHERRRTSENATALQADSSKSGSAPHYVEESPHNLAFDELRSRAIKSLDEALHRGPTRLRDELEVVEALIVEMRNRLIEHRRAGSMDDEEELKTINRALSAVVGVEYPQSGVHRKILAGVRDSLIRTRSAPSQN